MHSCLVASLLFLSDVVIFNLYSDANWNFALVSCGINYLINSCKMITVDLKFYLDIAVQSAKAKSKYEGTVYSIYTEFKIYILLVQELAGK